MITATILHPGAETHILNEGGPGLGEGLLGGAKFGDPGLAPLGGGGFELAMNFNPAPWDLELAVVIAGFPEFEVLNFNIPEIGNAGVALPDYSGLEVNFNVPAMGNAGAAAFPAGFPIPNLVGNFNNPEVGDAGVVALGGLPGSDLTFLSVFLKDEDPLALSKLKPPVPGYLKHGPLGDEIGDTGTLAADNYDALVRTGPDDTGIQAPTAQGSGTAPSDLVKQAEAARAALGVGWNRDEGDPDCAEVEPTSANPPLAGIPGLDASLGNIKGVPGTQVLAVDAGPLAAGVGSAGAAALPAAGFPGPSLENISSPTVGNAAVPALPANGSAPLATEAGTTGATGAAKAAALPASSVLSRLLFNDQRTDASVGGVRNLKEVIPVGTSVRHTDEAPAAPHSPKRDEAKNAKDSKMRIPWWLIVLGVVVTLLIAWMLLG